MSVMARLLRAKAEVNARTNTDTSALAFALHDPEKVKLLLEHGATVPDAVVFTAVAMPDGAATVSLLANYGARGRIPSANATRRRLVVRPDAQFPASAPRRNPFPSRTVAIHFRCGNKLGRHGVAVDDS
jgi:hypothetical protein